jgi:hypothetical protein
MNTLSKRLPSAGANFWSTISARLVEWGKSFVDWRPVIARLPRSECHFLTLDARGVPARMLSGSVRLQLLQLTGIARLGFVFRAGKDKISVWYWDEDKLTPEKLAGLTPSSRNIGFAPWPESVLRLMPEEGLHLLKLEKGYEALSVKAREIHRTRWYAALPDAEKWATFVRDAGYSTHDPCGALPRPRPVSMLQQPPKGWKLHSHFLAPVSLKTWGIAAVLALLGAGFLAASVYQVKLGLAIDQERQAVDLISRENAESIDLQRQIDAQADYLAQLRRAQPEVLQLEIMRVLAESGLINRENKTSLLEWEYRNKQLRLLFIVPPDLALGEFLTRLEALPIFKEIRLLPDTPPRTVGVQTVLAPWQPQIEVEQEPKTTTAPEETRSAPPPVEPDTREGEQKT